MKLNEDRLYIKVIRLDEMYDFVVDDFLFEIV